MAFNKEDQMAIRIMIRTSKNLLHLNTCLLYSKYMYPPTKACSFKNQDKISNFHGWPVGRAIGSGAVWSPTCPPGHCTESSPAPSRLLPSPSFHRPPSVALLPSASVSANSSLAPESNHHGRNLRSPGLFLEGFDRSACYLFFRLGFHSVSRETAEKHIGYP
jgi:hypothetical protein